MSKSIIRPKVYFGKGTGIGMRVERRTSWLERNAGPWERPLVYGSGGVSPRVVLASGGLARGETIRVSGVEKPSARGKVFTAVAKPAMREEKKVVKEARAVEEESQRVVKPPREAAEERTEPKGLSEREKMAVEFFEQMESMKPLTIGEKKEVEEPMLVGLTGEGSKEVLAEEAGEVVPGLSLVETGGKRKRRRGKRDREVE